MAKQNEMQAIDQALNGIEELETPIVFLEKRRDSEDECDVADGLRRRKKMHLGLIRTGQGSKTVTFSFYHSRAGPLANDKIGIPIKHGTRQQAHPGPETTRRDAQR